MKKRREEKRREEKRREEKRREEKRREEKLNSNKKKPYSFRGLLVYQIKPDGLTEPQTGTYLERSKLIRGGLYDGDATTWRMQEWYWDLTPSTWDGSWGTPGSDNTRNLVPEGDP